jgi:hypothetical protein
VIKLITISVLLLLSGCTSLGDVEGLGRTGEHLRTMDSVCKRLHGHSCDAKPINAPAINRTTGEVKQLPYYIKTGNIPQIIQQLGVIFK